MTLYGWGLSVEDHISCMITLYSFRKYIHNLNQKEKFTCAGRSCWSNPFFTIGLSSFFYCCIYRSAYNNFKSTSGPDALQVSQSAACANCLVTSAARIGNIGYRTEVKVKIKTTVSICSFVKKVATAEINGIQRQQLMAEAYLATLSLG